MTAFTKWLDTFTTEKGLDMEQVFTVNGPSGDNHIPLGCVIDAIKSAPARYDHGLVDGKWSDLPVGSFAESGTNINTSVLTIRLNGA